MMRSMESLHLELEISRRLVRKQLPAYPRGLWRLVSLSATWAVRSLWQAIRQGAEGTGRGWQ